MDLYILDTDIVTLLHHKHSKTTARFSAARDGFEIGITVITYYEAVMGRVDSVLKAADVEHLRRAQSALRDCEKFLEQFEVLWFEEAAFEWVERLRHNKKLSRKMGLKDLLIACIALAHRATLVTRNTKDFANIPNLKLDNWAD